MGRMLAMYQVIIATLIVSTRVSCILNNQETVDITQDSNFNCHWFGGSDPKLQCNCRTGREEFVIKHNSIPPYEVAMINITNCGKITIESNAISEMRSLRSIHLENIQSLILQPESLFWMGFVRTRENIIDWDPSVPSIRIRIDSCRVDNIANNAIQGRINLLEIVNSNLVRISPFAVSKLQQMLNIRIDGSSIKKIEPQSFKKFTTQTFIISNTIFDTIPSRAFYDIDVLDQFILDNVTVLETLLPSGFIINDPYRFELLNSQINSISGDALKVATRGSVTIKNNIFNQTGIGAFRSITLHKEDEHQYETIRFERNVFNTLSKDALVVDTNSFRVEFNNLQMGEICECGNLERYFRHNENTLELSCMTQNYDNNGALVVEWISVDTFQNTKCGILDTKSGTVYIIVGVSAIILVIIGSLVAFYFLKLHRSNSYGNKAAADKNSKVSMIVPDGRTYRETELHVIVERADLLTTDL